MPAPQMGNYGENDGPVGGVSPPIPSVTAPSGSLRGDSSLLGGNAPRPDSDQSHSATSKLCQAKKPTENSACISASTMSTSRNPSAENWGLLIPAPVRCISGGSAAAKILKTLTHAGTYAYEKLYPDLFAPPSTDKGDVKNVMWPLGLSHNRLGSQKGAGWARQQNIDVLPIASAMAGVDMRLQPNAYRELHWHTSAEWALMLKGSCRITAMNEDGKTFVDDLTAGDVWFFPAGVPHSIQALDQGTEFLLVFDQGVFSEENTFLATEMMLRNPVSVLSTNFKADVSEFDNIPKEQLYIFNGTPAPKNIEQQNQTSSAGALTGSESYAYHWSQQEPFTFPGGSVKILDPQTFPVASNFSAAPVVVQPGAMREIHWHTTSDEWNYFLQGSGRVTVFQAPESSRTFDFTAGDVGYVKVGDSHYIENTGTEDVVFLEVLRAPRFTDISVAQWLALTPEQAVKDTLNLSDALIDSLPKEKEYIKPENFNMTALAGGTKNFRA
ncbi:Oxalate decarboxylase OxdD [Colletotrichum spinosum]|uniref:Oxalate decarboxylase OxdD n=1 Tax=Colletotrichum spinosum TaxID=1347390 RepID=A0A4R8Q0Q9_9PEZI|nr:Oxalate decarboxylase OxdD [Colletotrichum spinosum]